MEKLTNLQVVSGQMNYPSLTNKVIGEEYAKTKVHMWLYMLNQGKKPTKWLKPNSKGTKVNFDFINSQEEYDLGLAELSAYISDINNAYGLDYELRKE